MESSLLGSQTKCRESSLGKSQHVLILLGRELSGRNERLGARKFRYMARTGARIFRKPISKNFARSAAVGGGRNERTVPRRFSLFPPPAHGEKISPCLTLTPPYLAMVSRLSDGNENETMKAPKRKLHPVKLG
jgi:hypothetical protein